MNKLPMYKGPTNRLDFIPAIQASRLWTQSGKLAGVIRQHFSWQYPTNP